MFPGRRAPAGPPPAPRRVPTQLALAALVAVPVVGGFPGGSAARCLPVRGLLAAVAEHLHLLSTVRCAPGSLGLTAAGALVAALGMPALAALTVAAVRHAVVVAGPAVGPARARLRHRAAVAVRRWWLAALDLRPARPCRQVADRRADPPVPRVWQEQWRAGCRVGRAPPSAV